MIRCNDCNTIIDEIYLKYINQKRDQTYKDNCEIEICPTCSSANLQKVRQCSSCDSFLSVEELDLDGLCPECVDDKVVEIEICATVTVTYKKEVQYKYIREFTCTSQDDIDNPLGIRQLDKEIKEQASNGNYVINNYIWEET